MPSINKSKIDKMKAKLPPEASGSGMSKQEEDAAIEEMDDNEVFYWGPEKKKKKPTSGR